MRIDRDLWRQVWQEGDFPSLPCSYCHAPLNFHEESLDVRRSAHNVELVNVTGDINDVRSGFSAWLICGNSRCEQSVSVTGFCTYLYDHDKKGNTITERFYSPKSILPGPPLIALTNDIPKPTRKALCDSFNLFWLDKEACANRLRLALELILKDWGFPATGSDGKFISLHHRIENWHALYGTKTIATSLMALKWLGNSATHEYGLSRDRLLDAFDIFAQLLRKLYPPDESDLNKLANEIAESKGR